MRKRALVFAGLAVLACLAGGCGANYRWRSSVPTRLRSVHVPTFRNETTVMEAGAVSSRQLLREFQREGTFAIALADDAALEVQGVVKSIASGTAAYDRRTRLRLSSYSATMIVEVSVIDKTMGKVVINNRQYRGFTSFSLYGDTTTAKRDAVGRAADEISQRIVDDIYNMKWDEEQPAGGVSK